MQSDTEWWVLDFTSMWQETDLALCSFYDGKEHLWKILVLSPPVSPVVSQHCLFFFAEGEPLHPDWDTVSQRLCLGLVSKETWKAEQRYSLELVPLRCCFRQFKGWGTGQDCERWATCQEVSRKRLQGSPAGSDCPALHAAHPPGTQHLWNGKAPCASLYLPCVCAARIPQKHKALRSPGLCQCRERKMQIPGMGEEVSVWRSKQRGWEVSRRQFQACKHILQGAK